MQSPLTSPSPFEPSPEFAPPSGVPPVAPLEASCPFPPLVPPALAPPELVPPALVPPELVPPELVPSPSVAPPASLSLFAALGSVPSVPLHDSQPTRENERRLQPRRHPAGFASQHPAKPLISHPKRFARHSSRVKVGRLRRLRTSRRARAAPRWASRQSPSCAREVNRTGNFTALNEAAPRQLSCCAWAQCRSRR